MKLLRNQIEFIDKQLLPCYGVTNIFVFSS